jgi:hypothetical protein
VSQANVPAVSLAACTAYEAANGLDPLAVRECTGYADRRVPGACANAKPRAVVSVS